MRYPLIALAFSPLALGCAGMPRLPQLTQLPFAKPAAPAAAAPSAYAPMPFGSIFETSIPGDRVLVTVDFDSIEDTVLDLPDEYGSGWLRLVVSDPANPAARSANVVAAERNRRFLSELQRGRRLDLLGRRVVHNDPMLNAGAPAIVLRVDQLRRHVAGARPEPARAPAQRLVYVNDRAKDDRLALEPDGGFQLRQRGHEISGTYELEGDQVTFVLPSGERSRGKRSGSELTDPDGKPWRLEGAAEPAAPAPTGDPLVFLNKRGGDDRLRLHPDGRFEIRERGKEVSGTYELEGEKLVFVLPGGQRAKGRRSGDAVTDPAGQEWTLETAAPVAAPVAAPAAAPAAAAEPAVTLVYVNERSKDDLLTLHPDGRFELRQRGRDVSGRYEAQGERLTFILAGGQRAAGKRSGDTVTDPDGKPWTLRR